MEKTLDELDIFAAQIRKAALAAMNSFHGGHLGGSMSMADLLAALYGKIMRINPQDPQWNKRDWLVVSKGHCGPAVYAVLALCGYFPEKELLTLNQGGTCLPSHCDRNKTPGIDMTTGSLGQGFSSACGIAWGMQYKGMPNYVYAILGDGECDEGQVWETALFAASKKLNHFIAFIDQNGKQLDGYTRDICDLGDLGAKFRDFGWYAQEVNGHDISAILSAVDAAKAVDDRPSMIVLHTMKGQDCCFAEHMFYNHFIRFTQEQYEEAIAFLDKKIEALQSEDGKCIQ
ncbi:MAG: transketolase [Spirochaetia bacterium]|jgi:transketolase|nr:transketolase [Spirochaetia bacterium]